MNWLRIDEWWFRLEGNPWKVIGWIGNLAFFTRFIVQWFASERQKRVVVPATFWYLSLAGSLLLLTYAVERRDAVFVFAYAFNWIPYIRNLILHKRQEKSELRHHFCPQCQSRVSQQDRFCGRCGERLPAAGAAELSGPP